MSEKKRRSFFLSRSQDGRSAVVQGAHVRMVASGMFTLITLCMAIVVQAAEVVESSTDFGVCNAESNDHESCATSIDGTSEGSSRVPHECTLVMAPSGISNNSGWGVFTLASLKRGQRVLEQGDIIIHIPDPNPHNADKMRRLVWDYVWDGQETFGHYEGLRVLSVSGGMGTLANSVTNEPNLVHGFPSVDNAGLKRGKYPGAGAITHHHKYSWTATKDLDAGHELFVEYGTGWFKERGFDGNVSPRNFEVSHLRGVGYCLDNIVPGASFIGGAGRGAFATRNLEDGAIVAPLPLIALSRSSLEMVKERQDGSLVVSMQLLQNYCFGHVDSSLLLYPYSYGVNYINHDSSPNVQLRWWDGSAGSFEKSFLELQQSSSSQLMLELVATRSISKDEEILLDYGRDWIKAWNDHVEAWQPIDDNIHDASAETMNGDDNFLILRTQQEQQKIPYPLDVFTSCYYQYSDHSRGNPPSNVAPDRSVARWKDGMIVSRNLRPCIVVKREKFDINYEPNERNSFRYTVHVLNRPTLNEVERIPKGHMHFVTHVPRHAIVFSDKMYTSDQHLENAFRKEIGLGDLFPEQWKDLL
ncbi:hypothetical protein ACHAXR_011620 [Thalassiosira sp. AJA248-18]